MPQVNELSWLYLSFILYVSMFTSSILLTYFFTKGFKTVKLPTLNTYSFVFLF